jgi:hypothetical protein
MNDEGSELLNKVLNNLDGGGGGGGGAGSDNASLGGGGVGSISNSHNTEEGEEGSMDLINNALKQSGGGGGGANNNASIEADTKAEQILEDLIQRQQAKKSLVQKMIDEATDPIILSILFIIFQSAPVQNLLTSALERVLVAGSTTAKYSVMAVQALLFALVYYILKKLLA